MRFRRLNFSSFCFFEIIVFDLSFFVILFQDFSFRVFDTIPCIVRISQSDQREEKEERTEKKKVTLETSNFDSQENFPMSHYTTPTWPFLIETGVEPRF